ncbi:hypothetical protein PRIPAC_93297 [Pristionchus pacificus]|uniref:Uncharacterized protein n=1 Tax=Pristionchus pacificus TaxID=54126 RepID=A0A2A6BP96_PRIPA|nr:hypothetical protein PRIPAC_93297 [Pristionchus pacificus]|eukprot:PDM67646.1 hypothetical protein PRIPAC_45690 [Pristionchus pacificus]
MEAHVDHMTLAKLHPDIMRNIILIELESVYELRLKFDGDAEIKAVADVLRGKQFGLANVAPDFKRSKGIANKNSIFFRNLPWDIPTQTAPQARPRDDILLANRIKFVDKFKRSNENISGEEEITEKVQHSLESLQRMHLRISGIEMCMFIDMTATDLKRIAKAMRNFPVNDLLISVRICDEESRAAILEIMNMLKSRNYHCMRTITPERT